MTNEPPVAAAVPAAGPGRFHVAWHPGPAVFLAGLAITALYGAIALVIARSQAGGWSWFVHPDSLLDGSNFYSIAGGYLGGPMTHSSSATFLWQQRALYPLLAALASGGDLNRLPAALVGVNVAAAGTLTTTLGLLLRTAGRPVWTATGPALSAGGLLVLLSDVADLVLVAAVAGAWLCLARYRRPAVAGMAFAAAVLTKESAWLFVLPALWSAARHRDRAALTWLGGPPVATYLGLILVQRLRFGDVDPFLGTAGRLAAWPSAVLWGGGADPIVRGYAWIFVIAPAVALGLAVLRDRQHIGPAGWAVLANVAVLLSLSDWTWTSPVHFTRLSLPVWLAAYFWLADRPGRRGLPALALLGPVGLLGYGLVLTWST